MSGILNGIRVLDFGRYIAGPFCGALLADLGADVIRVERIDGGEDRRGLPLDRVGAEIEERRDLNILFSERDPCEDGALALAQAADGDVDFREVEVAFVW